MSLEITRIPGSMAQERICSIISYKGSHLFIHHLGKENYALIYHGELKINGNNYLRYVCEDEVLSEKALKKILGKKNLNFVSLESNFEEKLKIRLEDSKLKSDTVHSESLVDKIKSKICHTKK